MKNLVQPTPPDVFRHFSRLLSPKGSVAYEDIDAEMMQRLVDKHNPYDRLVVLGGYSERLPNGTRLSTWNVSCSETEGKVFSAREVAELTSAVARELHSTVCGGMRFGQTPLFSMTFRI